MLGNLPNLKILILQANKIETLFYNTDINIAKGLNGCPVIFIHYFRTWKLSIWATTYLKTSMDCTYASWENWKFWKPPKTKSTKSTVLKIWNSSRSLMSITTKSGSLNPTHSKESFRLNVWKSTTTGWRTSSTSKNSWGCSTCLPTPIRSLSFMTLKSFQNCLIWSNWNSRVTFCTESQDTARQWLKNCLDYFILTEEYIFLNF